MTSKVPEEALNIKNADDLDKAITKVQSKVARLNAIAEKAPKHTTPPTYPDFKDRPFNPSTPFVTDKDIVLQNAWINGGTAELVHCIQSIGKDYQQTRPFKVW